MKQKKLKVSETSKILADELRRELAKVRCEEIRKNTIEKWGSLGFLDGLTGFSDEKKKNIAQLYESQGSQLLIEPQSTTYSADTIPMPPIIKRVLGQIGDNPIVNITKPDGE